MTIIAGVEAVPFYYWGGSYFNNNLKLINFHKHLLVIGLERPEDLEGIPSISYNNPLRFEIWESPEHLAYSLNSTQDYGWYLQKKSGAYKIDELYVKKEKTPFIIIGLVILLAGVIFMLNNFPFCSPLYDQYHGDRGSLPYQNLIDYVEKKGGMVFWAHPDIEGKHEC